MDIRQGGKDSMKRRTLRSRAGILVILGLVVTLLLFGCGHEESVAVTEEVANAAAAAPNTDVAASEPEAAEPPDAADAMEPAEAAPVESPYASVDGRIETGEYAHEIRLGGMDVHWSNDAELLWIGLSAPGTGYVSIGFDPVDRKVGANYIIGYVADGETIVRDHVGTRGNLHAADTEVGGTDDLLAAAGSETDGRTVLEFVIPLDSGDPQDRPLVPGETYVIQTAYQSERDDFISWHSRHGIGEFTLDPAP